MKEVIQGIIGVVLGLSLVLNGALIYNGITNGTLTLPFGNPQTAEGGATESLIITDTEGEEPAPQATQRPDGLAMYTNARAPIELGSNLYKSVHSMVYDNEAVFYIAYSNEVAANEAGYNKNKEGYNKQLNDLWYRNINSFIAKNKEYSDSLKRYQSDAYATFFIVDDDDHEKILAIISDGKLYYEIGAQPAIDPFSVYDTRWNKYIRRDLSELLDNPSDASLPEPVVTKTIAASSSGNTTKPATTEDVRLETNAYYYDNGTSSTGLISVKNNSAKTVAVSVNGRVIDKEGKLLGSGTGEIRVLGPGETSAVKLNFDKVTGGDHIQYDYHFNLEESLNPIVGNLTTRQSTSGTGMFVSVTNNGSAPARYVRGYAVFFDANNKVVGIDETSFADADREIKSGATVANQMNSAGAYDHALCFLEGYNP